MLFSGVNRPRSRYRALFDIAGQKCTASHVLPGGGNHLRSERAAASRSAAQFGRSCKSRAAPV